MDFPQTSGCLSLLNFSLMQSSITLRDIGAALGVSHVTVSLALRNSPRIPEKRRLQIQKKAREMGYRPNAMAAALAHLRKASQEAPISAALGWLNFWDDPAKLRSFAEFDSYWQGATEAAEECGYHLDEFQCSPNRLRLDRLEGVLLSRGIQGVLIPPQKLTASIMDFSWDKFSAIRFGRSVPEPRLHLVTADQMANAMLAVEKARELGYRRIGYVSSRAFERGSVFLGGFLLAQRLLPRAERIPVLELDNINPGGGQRRLERWLVSTRPDAILTDIKATGGMLQKAGCRVPDDVGLGAMSVLDGSCDAGINQNAMEIGRVAILMLVSLVHNGDRGIPPIFRQVLVEGFWQNGSMMPDRTPPPARRNKPGMHGGG